MTNKQRVANRIAFAIGLAASAAVITGYLLGGLDWLENKTLDWRFRYANASTQFSDELVAIDIDDESLEKVGRWPWPRDVQAALLATVTELGARAIVIDLTWNEPEVARTRTVPDADILFDLAELTETPLERIFPDQELRAALAAGGNAYLAVHYQTSAGRGSNQSTDDLVSSAWDRSRDFERVLAAARDQTVTPAALARRLELPVGWVEFLLDAARVARVLEADPRVDDDVLAASTGLSAAQIRRTAGRCRQYVLRRYIRRAFEEHSDWRQAPPSATIAQLYVGLDPPRPLEDETALRAALCRAYREVLSYEATTRNPLLSFAVARELAVEADAIVPVYFPLAREARRCGFVAFEPDADGVVRRLALLATHDGRVLAQLAFGAGCDLLGVGADGLVVRRDELLLRPADSQRPAVRIQLDGHGRTLVPWVPIRDLGALGTRLPADAVWQAYDRRRQQQDNRVYERGERRKFLANVAGDASAAYGALFEQTDAVEHGLMLARYRNDASAVATLRAQLEELDGRIRAFEAELLRRLAEEQQTLAAAPDAQGAKSRLGELDFALRQVPALEQLAADITATDARLQREIDETLALLRAKVAGRVCLIGYTATSLADMTPIPTSPRAPGVLAHANLLNGLLTGRMVAWATPTLNALLAAGLGVAMTLAAVRSPPRSALLLLAVALVGFTFIAVGLFRTRLYWLALTPGLGALLAAYVAISFYRFAFVERERRQLTTALSQYTSVALARQMADNAELCRRAESREVTAMFTDLAGFTTLSERIGAERTQRVLNISLGRFSEVMLVYEAMINKFIGDGIFAFWNPVIYPQLDHARRACETAIDLQVGLARLIDEQRAGHGDEVFNDLVLRVGVATGSAVVGPCGSEQKYDYTCIGDSVNVASRLESANKFFGTRILVSGATRAQAGDGFVYRSLGGVQVKGKTQAVPVYELLGRTDRVAPELCDYAARFGAAVQRFQARDWPAAQAAFEDCRQIRPDDAAAERFALAAGHYAANPPAPDWNGAIELSEK